MTLLREKGKVESEPEPFGLAPAERARYETDAFGWAMQQAQLLRAGRLDQIDVANIADEIADVAGGEYDKIESALARILQHLLKWDHQPERRSRSWVQSIREHRRRVERQLRKNPGLKPALPDALAEAYEDGRGGAWSETGLPQAVFPETLPYSWDEIMHREIALSDE